MASKEQLEAQKAPTYGQTGLLEADPGLLKMPLIWVDRDRQAFKGLAPCSRCVCVPP